MVKLFYRACRCGVRFIRYILGTPPRHSSYVPLHIPKRFYFQLRAIAAHQHHCSPSDLPRSAVAATLADLIELGLYYASLSNQPDQSPPTAASESSELAHLWAEFAAMQQRIERLEDWGSHLPPSTHPHPAHADYSAINRQIESHLMPIAEQLKLIEDQIHELRHQANTPRPSFPANLHNLEPQMQTLTAQIHDLHVGMEQMTSQRADWQQTFLATQQQFQGLEQRVMQLSSEMAQLQSMRPYLLENLPQTTGQPQPSRTYQAAVPVQWPSPSQPVSQVSPSIKTSGVNTTTPHSQEQPSTIEAEILHTSRLTDIDWERSPHSPFVDLEGITQLELCNRFGLSHHTLVRDSQKAGFSSVPAYLEAKTGFHARQVGRWWRYYSDRKEI